eukprot:TRINITY_DN197_c0_g1_i6.p3 TRINITY_DN197_c0_g1~~TRINITY_DN197_c0_g1_i6.p3  ORF type:complete len:124 (-),score=14.56 TRINITY_DN197_c0_g1_i6:293-664(-)
MFNFCRGIYVLCAILGFSFSGRKQELTNMANQQGTTFDLVREDHTVANSLRYMLNQNAQVTFCGYSQPHPSEQSVHLRVQTTNSTDPALAMRDACGNIMDMCAHVKQVFLDQVELYKENNKTE